MDFDFSVEELDMMHNGLITRERVIREQWIPHMNDNDAIEQLKTEADTMRSLSLKVCAAKISKELGFPVPVPVSI